MATTKAAFTLDRDTIARLRETADRLAIPPRDFRDLPGLELYRAR